MIVLVVRFFSSVIGSNLKGREFFLDQTNRNQFDIILDRRNKKCSPMKNLRYLNSGSVRQQERFLKQSINPVRSACY